MQFATLHVGGPDLVFPASTVLIEAFSLAAPANAAAALLQSFDLRYPDGDDHDVRILQLQTVMRFAPGQSTGFLEVRFSLDDGDPSSGPIGAELSILVVAI